MAFSPNAGLYTVDSILHSVKTVGGMRNLSTQSFELTTTGTPFYSPLVSDNTSSSGSNVTEDYLAFYNGARYATGLLCFPIVCLYGLTGNVFILLVFSQKSMQTSTNIYLSALAVSDIIKLINDFLYFLTIFLMKVDPVNGNRCFGYLYPYAHFIFNVSVPVSSWLTVSVAVERYILVCHPIWSKSIITVRRAKYISAACFIVMMPLAIPSALRYRTVTVFKQENGVNVTELDVETTDLWKDEAFQTGYNWMQTVIRTIIPIIILVVMDAFIINALRKTRANKRMASRNKITIMLVIVIIFFLVCVTPDCVMSSIFSAGYAESENNLIKGVREITDFMLAVNAAINFTLYMVFNKLFRDQFVALFCRRCTPPNVGDEIQTKYAPIGETNPQHKNGVAGTAV